MPDTHFFVGFSPPSSGQKWKTPRARSPGHDATRSTRHTRTKPKFRLWRLCCHRKKETLTGRLLGFSLHKHTHTKTAYARAPPPPHAAARPFPYRPLLTAPRDYDPSPIGRIGQTQTWPVHCLGMPPRQPGQCLAGRYRGTGATWPDSALSRAEPPKRGSISRNRRDEPRLRGCWFREAACRNKKANLKKKKRPHVQCALRF